MKNLIIFIAILCAPFSNFLGHNKDSLKVKPQGPEPLEFVFRPKLSVGMGMLTFYGDIGSNHSGYHPTVSRLGYDLRLINPLTEYLDLSFFVLFGQVSANERTVTRNLNFNSNITTGGFTLNYNFSHLLKKKRIFDPYFQLGFESMEFLSKTDLKDNNGNYYYYWSDGTIMNMDENDPNASNAIELSRDYTYESDIREENLDGFGSYRERTFGIPLEIGANLHTGERLKFRVGTSIHFTFTDLIDGVTHESLANRAGDSKKDRLLYTHFALSYDLTLPKKTEEIKPLDEFDDLFRMDTTDSDGDLVSDLIDRCAKTPLEIRPVDEYGCPLDTDKDGVPDYIDEELNSPDSAKVNDKGVAYTDEDYLAMYRMYKDSVGEFSEWDELRESFGSDMRSPSSFTSSTQDTNTQQLFIVIGSDVKGTSANDLYKELSNKNFKIIESGDSVLYVLGGYETVEEVAEVIPDIQNDSLNIESVVVVETDPDKNTVEVVEELTDIQAVDVDDSTIIVDDNKEIVYRVQVGAFKRKLSLNVFKGLPDLVYVRGEDSLYRYYTGAFSDKSDAAMHKVNMSTNGYNGAFLVAFQEGKRISLADAGFQVNPDFDDNIEMDTVATSNPVDSTLIKFRVQVGAYSEKIPTDALDVFLEIGNVTPKRDDRSGLTKYFIGLFESYEAASNYKLQLIEKGLEDCFVVGEFKGNIVTAGEALELLK